MPRLPQSRHILRNGIVVVVFSLGICLSALRLQHIQPTQQPPFGHFSPQQILARTVPICQVLLPLSDVVQFTVEPHSQEAMDGRVCRSWEVDCFNGKHAELAYFWWNVESGALTQFALWTPPVPVRLPLPLTREAAVRSARQWMERLGWGPGGQWQICQTPRLGLGLWNIVLRKQGRRIRTWIDAGSGLMVSAIDWNGVTTFKVSAH